MTRRSAVWLYEAPLLDLAGICTQFSGAITTQFCFTYTLDGVTVMLRGLHASLCHAFLVIYCLILYLADTNVVVRPSAVQ